MSLGVTVGDAKPEVNFPGKSVLPLHLGFDGSVLLGRVDLNEACWEFLLFFAELLGFTLCHWVLVEPWGDEVSRMYCRLLSKEGNTNIIEPTGHL